MPNPDIIPPVLRPFRSVLPTVHPTAYIDQSAQVIGDVEIGQESSVWMNVVIRGDVNTIRIGDRTNIQDGTVIHVMRGTHPTRIGHEVTVGHAAILHGCTIHDRVLIGMGAMLLNGAEIGEDSIVAAGTLVPEREEVSRPLAADGAAGGAQARAHRRGSRQHPRLRRALRRLPQRLHVRLRIMSTQPARGMRDFLPEDVRRREYVVGIIRDVYDRYGFEPLETPAAENIETLLGKYGDEGNKLIFKILKRGEHEASGQADLALRYDLTVPLARVVAEYQSKLPKFFKRYQIQPVWRADRPARGRFREFYQCDIDSVGSTSPVVEAEQIAAVSEILTTLGFEDFVIRINHRKFIAAWLNQIPIPAERHADVLITIDKVDKIGKEGVAKELAEKSYSDSADCGHYRLDWGASSAAMARLARRDSFQATVTPASRTCVRSSA